MNNRFCRCSLAVIVLLAILLCACGESKYSLSFKSISKKTTIEDIKGSFGEADKNYKYDYYDALLYYDINIGGILAENATLYFVPNTGTLMRIEFDCYNKGVSKEGLEQLIKDLTKTEGKPIIEDKVLDDYYTCYYWNNDSSEFKCVAFSVDGDEVIVFLNYDWWYETVGF